MLLWRMEFGGENGSFGSGLMPSAQDDRGNLGAFPVLHVILSERSESKNPLPFGEFERMRVLRRASLAQDDRGNLGAFPVLHVILSVVRPAANLK